jgi:ATP diphosphatase
MSERPKQPEPSRDVARLVEIMAALRTPETGCPWDLDQTFASIAPYTIEEAYEVADAIERGDFADLKEELGDLLLQVVYHSRLGEESGAFDFGDVVMGITRKMIRRHPHVFGDAERLDIAASQENWARIKAEERSEKAAERLSIASLQAPLHVMQGVSASVVLADVPSALPALTRAVKLQDKAAAVGFDWPSLAPVFEKMREELAEFEDVALAADPRGGGAGRTSGAIEHTDGSDDKARIEEEFGDLLFVMANVARHSGIDPETALRRANDKFTRRFAGVEQKLHQKGSAPADSTLAEMDALWNEVKAEERAGIR